MTLLVPTKPSTAIPDVDLDADPMVWLTPCWNLIPMMVPKAQPYAKLMTWVWPVDGDFTVNSGIVTAKVTHTVNVPAVKLRVGDILELYLYGEDIKGM